ncbi:MAG: oligosaccharide flippase family protein, partial [Candidatus Bathyarchaeota archaeon]|nr:oligosaccharide flippase family protein [Candidatus Bathyarchaeota archaeon]
MAEAAKGTLYIVVQNALQYLVLFLFYVMVARILSPADIGKISILVFFMTVFTVFTQFSLPVASAKFISESMGKGEAAVAGAVAEKAFRLVLLFSVPSMLLASFLSPWFSTILFGTDVEAGSLVVVAVTCVVLNVANLYSGDLRGLGKFREMALAGLAYVAFSRGLGVILAWFGYGVQGVVVGWFLGAVIFLFLSRFFIGGELPHSGGGDFGVKALLAYCYPVLAYSVVTIIQGWVDVMLLYALTSDLALEGIYYLAVSGSTIVSVVWVAIATTMLPLISAKYGRGGDVGGDIAVSTRFLNLTVLPFSLSLAAASQTAVVFAYGSGYLSGVLPFAVLTSASIIWAYVSLFSTVLQAVGETRVLMNIGLISSVLDVIVIVVLGRWL